MSTITSEIGEVQSIAPNLKIELAEFCQLWECSRFQNERPCFYCPFAPYADRNVKETSLKRALRSPLMETIRANHAHLEETSGGCALWREREWVASLVGKQGRDCAASGCAPQ
ncbi:MAG: hypothetical protein JW768_08585 [Chitinispirillaceae bacterium]|nr:hypothetical protein [Chitinispirillaceae bacterium]